MILLKAFLNYLKPTPQLSEGQYNQLLETILMYQQENLELKIEILELRTIKWN